MKRCLIILFVFLSVCCSKEGSVSEKDTEAKSDKEVTEVDKTKPETTSERSSEDRNFPTRALDELEDVLSKGEPYVSEESWEKLLRAASQVEKNHIAFGETSGTLYREMGEKIEAMSTKDEERIAEMQEEVKSKIDAARPTKEQMEAVVKEAGFENLEEAVEIAKRAPKVDFLYKLLVSIEASLETADVGDLTKEAHLTSRQKESMKEMAEVAKQDARDGIEHLGKELEDKPYYTRKDVEIFSKCRERYNDVFVGIVQLGEQLD